MEIQTGKRLYAAQQPATEDRKIQPERPYFKNLNALRGIAFLSVFLGHAFEMSENLSGQTFPVSHWITQTGGLGVNFFFVLSAFLITYLLLFEEKNEIHFNISRFYLRRILRIWPLYFGVVVISFFIIPPVSNWLHHPINESSSTAPYFLFYSNFEILKNGFPYSPLLAVLWSIAVEEQFYFCWPWFLKLFRRNRIALFIAIVMISITFRADFYNQSKLLYFHTLSIMSDFALGGFLAWLSMVRENFVKFFTRLHPFSTFILYGIFFWLLLFYQKFFSGAIMITLERIILGAGFAFIIAEQSFGKARSWHAGRIKILSWLGKISFGLYCFHMAALVITKDLLNALGLSTTMSWYLLLPSISLLVTTLVAAVSYYTFEARFLKWKRNWD